MPDTTKPKPKKTREKRSFERVKLEDNPDFAEIVSAIMQEDEEAERAKKGGTCQ